MGAKTQAESCTVAKLKKRNLSLPEKLELMGEALKGRSHRGGAPKFAHRFPSSLWLIPKMHILRVSSKELKKKEWLEAESSEKWFQQLAGAEKVVWSSSPMELEGLVNTSSFSLKPWKNHTLRIRTIFQD